MSDIISKLKTPQECAIFEKNVLERGNPALAVEARKRALLLRSQSHGAHTEVERQCLEAVYAYEGVLSRKNGKNTRASRTWNMIKRHGIIPAVERAVNRPAETDGYRALVDMGLSDYAFEAVILRHPASFGKDTVLRARSRLTEQLPAS